MREKPQAVAASPASGEMNERFEFGTADALVVIDVINDFEHEDGDGLFVSFEERLTAMTETIAKARRDGVPIIYVNDERSETSDADISLPETAVAEATEQLHEDTAYEFEMRWRLWVPEPNPAGLDTTWRLQPARVRVVGFGPDFDLGSYEQNGHVRVDFGLDTPWTFEGTAEGESNAEALDADTAKRVQQNIEKLLAFTLSVEKHCGISSRLLWTESGEPLAEKLIARLQRLN